MKKDSLDFHYQLIKGRLAEAIIEEMFVSCGYEVHRFGMENMMPNLVRALTENHSPIATQIKKMPDFIIKKDKAVFFIEVKYRADGCFESVDLHKGYSFPYNECHIVVVSRHGIKCLTVQELEDGKSVSDECDNHLCNRDDLELDEATVNDYVKIVRAFFSNELKTKFSDLR